MANRFVRVLARSPVFPEHVRLLFSKRAFVRLQLCVTIRIAGILARSAVHISLEHGREVGRAAEAAALGHFGYIQAKIEQHAFGEFDTLANEEVLQGCAGGAPENTAQVAGREMKSAGKIGNGDRGCAVFFDKLGYGTDNLLLPLAVTRGHLTREKIHKAKKHFSSAER